MTAIAICTVHIMYGALYVGCQQPCTRVETRDSQTESTKTIVPFSPY